MVGSNRELTKHTTEKKVRVLMSVYNGEAYLRTQLESLVFQQGVQVSLTVRDDASRDNSCQIVEEFESQIPVTLIHGENVGAARSFMELVHQTEEDADYYAFCDQDDYWLPEKLQRAVEKIESDGCDTAEPVLYYSNVKRVGSELEEIDDPFKKNYHTETFPAVILLTEAPGCTMVFNKALLLLLKSYMPKYLPMHDSWTLRVCASAGGRVIYDDASYIHYRQHEKNEVGGLEKMEYRPLALFMYRIHKLFDFSYHPYRTGLELLEGYSERIPLENQKILMLLLKSKKNIVSRSRILFGRKIRTPYFIYNLKFKLQVLVNQI